MKLKSSPVSNKPNLLFTYINFTEMVRKTDTRMLQRILHGAKHRYEFICIKYTKQLYLFRTTEIRNMKQLFNTRVNSKLMTKF